MSIEEQDFPENDRVQEDSAISHHRRMRNGMLAALVLTTGIAVEETVRDQLKRNQTAIYKITNESLNHEYSPSLPLECEYYGQLHRVIYKSYVKFFQGQYPSVQPTAMNRAKAYQLLEYDPHLPDGWFSDMWPYISKDLQSDDEYAKFRAHIVVVKRGPLELFGPSFRYLLSIANLTPQGDAFLLRSAKWILDDSALTFYAPQLHSVTSDQKKAQKQVIDEARYCLLHEVCREGVPSQYFDIILEEVEQGGSELDKRIFLKAVATAVDEKTLALQPDQRNRVLRLRETIDEEKLSEELKDYIE